MTQANTLSLRERAAQLEHAPRAGLMSIGGELVESSGGWLESVNPATGAIVGKVPNGTAADVEQAVAAAEAAQVGWAELSVAQRSQAISSRWRNPMFK